MSKLWPEGYIAEHGEDENPCVTASTMDEIECNHYQHNPITVDMFLFATAHIFSELRNVTIQLNRIANALELSKDKEA